jgi:hypothetical protein
MDWQLVVVSVLCASALSVTAVAHSKSRLVVFSPSTEAEEDVALHARTRRSGSSLDPQSDAVGLVVSASVDSRASDTGVVRPS